MFRHMGQMISSHRYIVKPISWAVPSRTRYRGRTEHPETDGEKLIAEGDRVTRIHRGIASAEATGEYLGVAKFSPKGAEILRAHYHRIREAFSGKPWREAAVSADPGSCVCRRALARRADSTASSGSFRSMCT